MRARECREYELSSIRVARMHGHVGAILIHFDNAVDVAQIELRIDSLGVKVECERDYVDIPRALAVAEERALHALGARHLREFCRGDRRAPVVVTVHAYDRTIARFEIADEPFDLIGKNIRGRALY